MFKSTIATLVQAAAFAAPGAARCPYVNIGATLVGLVMTTLHYRRPRGA